MSCLVSCRLGVWTGARLGVPGLRRQAATAGGQGPSWHRVFMHNCWCESQISVVYLSRPCLSLLTPLKDRHMQGCILVEVGSAAKLGGIQLEGVGASCRCQLALRRGFVLDGRRIEPARFARPSVSEAVMHDVKYNNKAPFISLCFVRRSWRRAILLAFDDLIYSR